MTAMGNHTIEILPLDAPDIDKASILLAQTFRNNPSTVYTFDGEPPDLRQWAWFLGNDIRHCLKYGVVLTTPGITGIAAWLPPGRTPFDLAHLFRNELLLAPWKIGWRPALRLYTLIRHAGRAQKQCAPEKFYYLSSFCVDSSHRGKGIGSALLAPLLTKADSEHMPCYLETETGMAIRFYRKHGFHVINDIIIPGNGPVMHVMLRESR